MHAICHGGIIAFLANMLPGHIMRTVSTDSNLPFDVLQGDEC